MVGASAGGGTDIVARMLAEKLGESLKQSFVVENKPGASNTIAADLTAKSPPDGHTLLVATNTGQAIAPHLLGSISTR
jgi:tripartite-type tricarboxylate transporter receptor subunit TctC